MSASTFLYLMMLEENRRREEEEEERERARRRKRREEEERKRKEHKAMVLERKNSPVVFNGEDWQISRCIKAIRMQPFTMELLKIIDEVKPEIVEREKEKFDYVILDAGVEYEEIKENLKEDLEKLKKLGIVVSGTQVELSKLEETKNAVLEETSESFGNTFAIQDGPEIELNTYILSSEYYFEKKYNSTNPERIEDELSYANQKISKYEKYAKLFRFLLNTEGYAYYKKIAESMAQRLEECNQAKREMDSYNSLTKEQLLVIKSYFANLDKLSEVSKRIDSLFNSKDAVGDKNDTNIYNLVIDEILRREEYEEVTSQVTDYVSRIVNNDQTTMHEVYELVKGEYPIETPNRFIYDYLIKVVENCVKEETNKEKKKINK